MKETVIKKDYIYLWEDLVDSTDLTKILDWWKEYKENDVNDFDTLPWFEDSALYYNECIGTPIEKEVTKIRDKMLEAARKSYNKPEIVPNTTTLVQWKEGKYMTAHKDNGYENDKDTLFMREFTAVMYINDDYEGGETFVLDEESGDEVISYEPKKNTMLIFRSDESCVHGVKEITAGRRLTMSMWFTTLDEHEEPLNY